MQHSSNLSRRRFLGMSSLASLAMGSAEMMRLREVAAQSSQRKRDTSVILVWLTGGLSHMDTYDMKYRAPAEYRGDFHPVQTNVSGIEICEHLPLHAQVADRFTLIRSSSHRFGGHDGAH